MRKKFMSVFSSVLLSALLAVIAVSGVWAAELPVSYDLREHHAIPSMIRHQGNWGLCWAFGAMGSIESNYMMNVSYDMSFDVPLLNDPSADNPHASELHLGWFSRKAETGQEYRVFSVVSGDNLLSMELLSMKQLEANPGKVITGGNWEKTAAILSRGFGYGPIPHSDLPYPAIPDTAAKVTNATLNALMANGTLAKDPTDPKYRSVLWVTNVDFLKYPSASTASDTTAQRNEVIREVKGIIMDRGALALGYTDVDYSRNETYKTYYCSEWDRKMEEARDPESSGGHAVVVVGWDDTFPKEHFQTSGRALPTIDGAWLIRNSWGDNNDTHDHGYFWMSYEQDVSFQSYSVSWADEDVFCYEWDHLGWCSDWGGEWKKDDSYAVNVYKTGDQPVNLNWIGFYTAEDDAELTFYVRNYGMTQPTASNVWTVAPSLTMTVSRDYIGYHTASLDHVVTIPANSYFSVGMKADKSLEMPIAVETRLKGYSDYARVSDGESFFSTDGINWTDGTQMILKDSDGSTYVSPMNACIKVFVSGAQQQEFSQQQKTQDWVINSKRVIDRPENTVSDGQLMEANNPSGENAAITTGREFSLFLLDSDDAPLPEGTQAELTFMLHGSDASYDKYYVAEDDDDSYTEGDETYYYGYIEKPGDEWTFQLYPEGYEPQLYVNDDGELFASYQRTVTVGVNGNVTLKADDIPTATAGHSAPVGYYDVFYTVSSDESPDVGTLPVIHITAQEDTTTPQQDPSTPQQDPTTTPQQGTSSHSGCDMGLSGWLVLSLTGMAVIFRKH
ncbi:MAG: hypothetical protein IJ587_03010 [Synergistaceae bacterium]|nr:hypothetical protein [Synergistaceae bacterium]